MKPQILNFECEIKALDDKPEGTISGYASVFGVKDSYSDVVDRGAFTSTLKAARRSGRMPAMLWQHDAREPIGVWTKMTEDDKGLYAEGRLLVDDVARARQAYALVKANGMSGLSIGYQTINYRMDEKNKVRTLTEVKLYEVSPVTFPALDVARIDTVKAALSIKTIREFEAFLRDEGGFSSEAAKAIASGGFKAYSQPRDEGEEEDGAEPRDEAAALTQNVADWLADLKKRAKRAA